MKKIITMVGTSIFEKYFDEQNKPNLKNYYNYLKEIRASQWDSEIDRIQRLKEALIEWAEDKQKDKHNISAETKSLFQLKKELNEDLEVYLLYSDTILSRLAAEILNEILPKIEINEIKSHHIEGLQISDRAEFNRGMSNLIVQIYDISNHYWDNVVINITGGYKATIPFLTFLALLNGCPIYYIFEDTDALIKIPKIKLSEKWFDWDELIKYEEDLKSLQKGIMDRAAYERIRHSDFYKNYSFLIWEDTKDYLAELNPIGNIIWGRLNEIFFNFYCTTEVEELIERDERLKKLMANQFSRDQIRKKKTQKKDEHYIFDAGDNPFRIYYREKDEEIYIYKAFNDHAEHIRYLESTPYNENILNQEFHIKTLKKEV